MSDLLRYMFRQLRLDSKEGAAIEFEPPGRKNTITIFEGGAGPEECLRRDVFLTFATLKTSRYIRNRNPPEKGSASAGYYVRHSMDRLREARETRTLAPRKLP